MNRFRKMEYWVNKQGDTTVWIDKFKIKDDDIKEDAEQVYVIK